MLDIKLIRERPDFVKEELKRRVDFDVSIVDEVLRADEKWRKAKFDLDKLKSEKNKESKLIAKVKKERGDIKSVLNKVKKIADKIDNKDGKVKVLEGKRDEILIKIPNLLDKEVPYGEDEEDNVEVERRGKKPEFKFDVKTHQEICEANDWYDLKTAAKHSGKRFYYLKNELVMLQFALYNCVLNKMISKGYCPIEVPPMLRKEALGKSVSLSDFKESIYDIEGEDLCLIGTSEHALAVLHADCEINHKDLPLKYVGFSVCFRKELGVTKDSKGIFRVHNFNKIEQFIFSKPEDSDELHKEILDNAKEIFDELGLHYRVVDVCSGDIGSMASRKFDIEAWLPFQKKYREMVSASNYRDYGARRLNVRYQTDKGTLEFVHTLNSTAIALTRVIIAIIEQYQTKDLNVEIPKVLRPYLGNRKFLRI